MNDANSDRYRSVVARKTVMLSIIVLGIRGIASVSIVQIGNSTDLSYSTSKSNRSAY